MLIHQQTVGRFELRDFLGRGMIGDVYLAWDPESNSDVALKIVRTDRADPDMLEAERNGTALQAQLARVAPQVAAVYEEGQAGDLFWVAMEYVHGTDLSRLLSGGRRFSESRAVSIVCQLCDMLEACHGFSAEIGERRIFGIVHGDIKPENIRLQDEDRVRVLDFGIAKHLSHTRRSTKNLFGSLPYTPPERLEKGTVDLHSDLWAVGVVLYRMVAGFPPWSGDDPEELENRIRRGERPAPLPPEVSPDLARIVKKSLAWNVAERYATAAEIKADLEAFAAGKPLPVAGATEAPREDVSATRRTTAPLDATIRSGETIRTDRTDRPPVEATRRTVDPEPVSEVPPPPPTYVPPPPPPVATAAAPPVVSEAPRRRPWSNKLVYLLVFLCLLGATQIWAYREMEEIRHDLVTQPNPDLPAITERYRRVSRLSLLGPLASETKTELRQAILAAGDRILASYHGNSPTTTETGWQKAQEYFQTALDIDYDRETRAKLTYARAHLTRIRAQTLKSRDEKAQANKDAIAEFRDAARRAPDWPDPYLGLARIYAYDQFDLEELQKALGELARRGYKLGRREKAMLADGYRMRGQELYAQAQKADGPENQLRLLEMARDHLSQSVAFYGEIPGFANVAANRTAAEAALDDVSYRLWELGY
ncbi:MAG TPA: serine/threonine-protein kinase [Thermoanaerobaculia bacterium]|nr:serine/threonine-protein kinase [Thermoanaerobaculia bacterium]